MVNVEFVNLSKRGIEFPHDCVGMVVAQPYLPSESFTGAEPYQFVPQAKQRQLAVLDETLAVARLSHHDGLKTHFTIIPEYGIPGLDGVDALEDGLLSKDWPGGSVLVGGTDGLTRYQYAHLLKGDKTHVEAKRFWCRQPTGIGDNEIWRIVKRNGILYLPDVGSKTTSFFSAFAGISASN